MQLSLVACYRHKPVEFTGFLDACQRRVAATLGSRFRPYDTAQVHATVIGMERVDGAASGFLNRNLSARGDGAGQMDFDGLLSFARHRLCPLRVQFAGFEDRDYAFTSRGERPFARSFSIQQGNVVLIGWPIASAALDAARRSMQRYNVLHAYHRAPSDVDNDFFLRIGVIDDPSSVAADEARELEVQIRAWLATLPPLIVNVRLGDVYVVAYESEELPLASTRAFALTDATLTAARMRALY